MAEAQGWVMIHFEGDSSEKVKHGGFVQPLGTVGGVGWALSPARGISGGDSGSWSCQNCDQARAGGTQEGTVKASGSGSEGSNGGGVGVVKSVHQNWGISCQNWHIKGLFTDI